MARWLACSLLLGAITQIVSDDSFAGLELDEEDGGEQFAGGVHSASLPFQTPPIEGLHWVELFEDGWRDRWTYSAHEKFTGGWESLPRTNNAIRGDHALTVMDEAKFHGIISKFPKIETNRDMVLAIQYEVLFENVLHCGGAYLKVMNTEGLSDMSGFNHETPYVIMFGPDRCGATNKVHFLLKLKNPVTGEWTEHHLSSPPLIPPRQDLTHLYTLIIRPDDTFIIEVDGVVTREGSLLEEFHPPLQTPEEISDPEDKKPDDWVTEPKIPDPSASKPEEWDESQPPEIPDENAKMPEDWMVNEPKVVPDPNAPQPDSWDEEDDGPWEAPLIPNPRCAEVSGCGPWSAPLIPNPNFWGRWKAPLIDNPEYKGIWKPRKIHNPAYYKLQHPHALVALDSIGFELWTMQSKIMFDNIVISRDVDALRRFTANTWKIRNEIEQHIADDSHNLSKEDAGSAAIVQDLQNMARWIITQYPVPCCGLVIFSLFLVCAMAWRRSGAKVQEKEQEVKPEAEETPLKTDEATSQTRQRAAAKKQAGSE